MTKLISRWKKIRNLGNYLYTYCDGVMYQIDKNSGAVVERLWFYGVSPETDQNKYYFQSFTILENGEFYLASSYMDWEDGLFKTKFPFKKK